MSHEGTTRNHKGTARRRRVLVCNSSPRSERTHPAGGARALVFHALDRPDRRVARGSAALRPPPRDTCCVALSSLRQSLQSRRRPQSRRDYPLNLSILLSGGKETNQDFLSSGERTGKSPAPNPAVPPQGNVVFGRVRLSRGVASRPSPS